MVAKILQSDVDLSKKPLENFNKYVLFKEELQSLGVNIVETAIDENAFAEWQKEFPALNDHYKRMGDVFLEKSLEHYLSYSHLNFEPNDIFIDIAASDSRFANELMEKQLLQQAYLLDLCYPVGINGNRIGANAANTGLAPNFASKLSLQCAFECFQGNADIGFISEAQRILCPGGMFIITPLYIDEVYYNCTSHKCDQDQIDFDSDAMKVWRNDEYSVPFSRHYSPRSFFDRIYLNAPDNLQLTVYFYANLPELMAHNPGQRIYCYFLLKGQKKTE